jgi:D-alanyl-D-alanine carboxypeptidase
MRKAVQLSLLFAIVLPALSATQERSGPPPEIRTLIDSFIKAVNSGSAEQFETMAKAHFSPAYLAKQTAADRARLLSEIRKQFGTATMERVVREGPDEPLEVNVKGSTGTTGVIRLSLDPASPFKVSDIKVDAGARKEGGRGGRGERPAVPIDPGMNDGSLAQALDTYLAPFAARDELSGTVLVARNGRPVFQQAYGYADRANKIANTTATRFNLGSINKKFTEVAVAQLTAAGKLATGDSLGALIPDYPQEMSKPATIAQLLGHTGGISDFFGDEFARMSKDRFRSNADYFALVSRRPALFAPGARNQYCNGCYITLGAIIERIAGVPYERYVAERIFAPAGMKDTGYPQSDAIEPGVAIGYTRRLGDGALRSNIFAHGAAGSAAGGGVSTVGDLLAFDAALRDGRLLNRAGGGLGIAGGAPGTNAVLESNGPWTVVVLTNFDPPFGENLGVGIMAALARGKG